MKKTFDGLSASELDAEAVLALDKARTLPPGPARTEAMKFGGTLRAAAVKLVGPRSPRRAPPG